MKRNFKSLKSKKLIVVLLHSGRAFLGGLAVTTTTKILLQCRTLGFDSSVEKIPRRKWQLL